MTFVKLAEPTEDPVNSQFPALLHGDSSFQVLVQLLEFTNLKCVLDVYVVYYRDLEVYNFHSKTNMTS